MGKMMLIDTSKCIGCKACQIACQQWHSRGFKNDPSFQRSMPAEQTTFTGSYGNPPDMSGINLTIVKFSEFEEGGQMKFLFFKDQCRHCSIPLCRNACWNAWYNLMLGKGLTPQQASDKADQKVAIIQKKNGIVYIHKRKCKPWLCSPNNPVKPCQDYANGGCPFPEPGQNLGIPRWQYTDWTGFSPVDNSTDKPRTDKCDFCEDRKASSPVSHPPFTPGVFTDSDIPACELVCPTDAILSGTSSDVQAAAEARVLWLKANGYPNADLYPAGFSTHVKWILTEDPIDYGVKPA